MTEINIVWNGYRPLKVIINDNRLNIYKVKKDYETYESVPFCSFSMEGKRLVPTENPGLDITTFEPNNTLLVDMGDGSYLFIGYPQVFTFIPREPIERYFSPVGNSEVPYPWAETKDTAYLMVERAEVYLTNSVDYQESGDPYKHFYRLPKRIQREDKENFKLKCSYKRLA